MMKQASPAKRVLALWLPNWPLLRLLNERPELSDKPVAIYERSRGGRRVRAVSALAAERGVRPEMPLAEAAALCGRRRLCAIEQDRLADRLALAQLADWCEQFSPTVGFESVVGQDPAAEAEGLLLDVTGLGRIFGGEGALARLVVRLFGRRRLPVRVAVADTIGAAWAMTRFGDRNRNTFSGAALGATGGLSTRAHCTAGQASSGTRRAARGSRVPRIVPPGESLAAAGSLPAAGLRLPCETVDLLASLGLATIGQVAGLPRESLLSRFGPSLLVRLDELTGAKAEVIVGYRPPPEFEAEWELPYPTLRQEVLREVFDRLLRQICRKLESRRQGALRLACRLGLEDGPPLLLSIGLFSPTARARHLGELIQMQWEQQRLRHPVTMVRLTVTASSPLELRQQELFDTSGQEQTDASGQLRPAPISAAASRRQERRLSLLVDRLSSRLGRDAVLGVHLVRDAVPEYACHVEPLVGEQRRGPIFKATRQPGSKQDQRDAKKTASASRPPVRPLCLLPRPQPVAVVAVAPDGPPAQFRLGSSQQEIVEAWGPERIETLWWRGRAVRRDYYRVETAAGERFWLFRRRDDGQWFLHGEFD